MKKHYEINGQLIVALDDYNYGAIDNELWFHEFKDLSDPDIKRLKLNCVPATTELDRYCLRMYGSMFDKINTDLQRVLENLYKKGGLAV